MPKRQTVVSFRNYHRCLNRKVCLCICLLAQKGALNKMEVGGTYLGKYSTSSIAPKYTCIKCIFEEVSSYFCYAQ